MSQPGLYTVLASSEEEVVEALALEFMQAFG